MKISSRLTVLLALAAPVHDSHAGGGEKDDLCPELKSFLASVEPDETRTVVLRTYWGAKEVDGRMVLGSKSCEHDDYEPGKNLCAYLMEHSSTEFAGHNAKRMINCLTPQPGIGRDLDIHSGSFSITFGSPDRGALVDLDVSPDKEPGEMLLRLRADGY